MKEKVNETVKKEFVNESTKKVMTALKEKGFNPTENSIIAFMFEEHEKEGYINFNFSGTGIRFKRSELDMQELRDGGIKVWGEWLYKG